MKATYFKEKIESLIADVRKQYPVDDDKLCDGGKIYYMNGNDSTEFDWSCNDRLCEFMVFWKESEVGFIKVFVYKSGKAEWYVYDDGAWKPKSEGRVQLVTEDEALTFAALMVVISDNKFLWDSKIDDLDWRIDTRSPSVHNYVCAMQYEPEEEDEWWLDDGDDEDEDDEED